jgi:hypothetical protein
VRPEFDWLRRGSSGWDLVYSGMNIQVPQEAENFLSSSGTISFLTMVRE